MAYNKGKDGQPVVHELKLPMHGDLIGRVTRALGASNFAILCSDNKERVCSIPGRLRRKFWIKEGDLVIVRPWVVQSDQRGDVIWRYSIMDKDLLRQKGYAIP